jgi:BirA family biotin operon repressor/biotin-[acetyl-CoA-carboxylase] ligase
MDTPFATFHTKEAASTQDEARARFSGFPLLVTTERQIAGRGRLGRTWLSAPRAVAASLAFRPGWPLETWPRLTLVAGLAAAEVAGDVVKLEWPNDLVVGEEKVGGLLAESDGELLVVGLGLNLFWPEPPAGMGALYESDPGLALSSALAESWAQRLLGRIAIGPQDWGRQEYLDRCATVGREIVWEPEGRGYAVGISDDGALDVETAEGTVSLRAGEVSSVRAC